MKSWSSEAVAKKLFFVAFGMMAFAYGVAAEHYGLPPVPQIKLAIDAFPAVAEESGLKLPWYFRQTDRTESARVFDASALAPGLRLISGLDRDERTHVRVITPDGELVHRWRIDWFEIWPDPDHLSQDVIPKSNPGQVLGLALLPDGDLIFNFTDLGMVRMDACGEVRWKLPYRTHHSIHIDDEGHIWAPGLVVHENALASRLDYQPPFSDYTIVEVSPDGRLLSELFLYDLLVDSDLQGLLYLGTRSAGSAVSGDVLHLNDVEVFPTFMTPGVFGPGDIMISLRNTNTVAVLDQASHHVKYAIVGATIAQHDPDFIDGNTISIFDNINLVNRNTHQSSRIITVSPLTNDVVVSFAGTSEIPFFTREMGKHQRLPNGGILLVESMNGRVVEVQASGEIVWDYVNLIGDGLKAIVGDAKILGPELDEAFFTRVATACSVRRGQPID